MKCTRCGAVGNEHRIQAGRTKSWCRPCESEKNKEVTRYRRSVMWRHKSMVGCKQCGIKDPRVLQYDHRDPHDKLFTPSMGCSNKGLRTIAKEIAKCDVLCANCHSIKTYENKDRQVRRKK